MHYNIILICTCVYHHCYQDIFMKDKPILVETKIISYSDAVNFAFGCVFLEPSKFPACSCIGRACETCGGHSTCDPRGGTCVERGAGYGLSSGERALVWEWSLINSVQINSEALFIPEGKCKSYTCQDRKHKMVHDRKT